MKNVPISLAEIIKAQQVLGKYLTPTPLRHYASLSRLMGAEIYIKHENHNLTGTFKIRGGMHLLYHLHQHGQRGVITFSTGNHGTSIATAARHFGMEAVVVVPENTSPAKTQAIADAGAELIFAGKTFEESSQAVAQLQAERDLYAVHPANEPVLINGVGTGFLEIYEALPDVDAVIIPLGAGSEVASAVTVFKALKPDVEIIAVQAENSSAAYQSWRAGQIVTAPNQSFAGGFATGTAYETTFAIYKDALSDFVLLTEHEIQQGIALAIHYTHNLTEGAGASTIMAAYKLRDQLQGKRVALQMSGSKITRELLAQVLAVPLPE